MPRKAKKRKSGRKWMQRAVKRPGAFRAKAKRAGMSTHAYAEREKNAPGRTGKEARLAVTFEKHRPGRRKTSHRKSSRSR